MRKTCSRCGRPPRGQEVPVRKIIVPFLLAVTRLETVEAELGWIDLESPSGQTSLCPECAAMPLLSQNVEEGNPEP